MNTITIPDAAGGWEAQSRGLGQTEPRDILNSIRAVLYTWDMVSDALSWGANVRDVLGALPAAALLSEAAFTASVSADCVMTRYQAIKTSSMRDVGAGAPYRLAYNLKTPAGAQIAVEDVGRWFADERGRPVRAHGVLRVTGEDAASPSATGDFDENAERGICSRPRMVRAINDLCQEGQGRRAPFAVVVAGIEGLPEINLRDGYDAADLVISAVARRLAENLRGTDLLARYIGGKFAILLSSGETEQVDVAVRRLIRLTTQDLVPTHTRAIPVRLRAGVAIAPNHGRNAHRLLQRAEEAFDLAAGRPEGFAVYKADASLAEARRGAVTAADEIVAALNERRILLAYQPVISAKTGRAGFYEALLRVRRDDGTIALPAAYLPIAEKSGLVVQLDHRVCELAFARMAAEPELRLSVNLSVATLQDPDWPDRFAMTLKRTPGVASRLIVEIIETIAVANLDSLTGVLAQIKALGVRIAMDDFGSGHTSFRNLRRLGIDIVKIDGAFVQNVARSADDRFFVRTLAELARHLGIETVAEWVEDAETQKALQGWGIDYLQGYHLGPAEVPQEPLLLKASA